MSLETVLSGRIAMVTGAAGGIGAAISDALVKAGATVVLVGRNAARLKTLAEQLDALPGQAICSATDIADDAAVTTLCSKLASDFGRLDVLVHCAALMRYGALTDAPVADLDAQYRTNVRAPVLITQQLLPLLKASKGQVVFVNSSAGLGARASTAHYAATKHALKAIADALRAEVNGDGVRVISVFPGRTATDRTAELHAAEGKPYNAGLLLQPADVAATIVNALTLPATAEITDINIRAMQKSY